jgi:hypothetical protein
VDLDDLPGVELRRAFTTEVGLALVALAELFTAAWAPTPAATPRMAARAVSVALLLSRTPVGIRIRVDGFHVLGIEVLVRISIVISNVDIAITMDTSDLSALEVVST